MQLFIDTANTREIATAVSAGFIEGVTTNPSIIAREKKPLEQCIREIREIGPELTILLEVVSKSRADMVAEAKELVSVGGPHAVIKLPATSEGIAAVRELSASDIRTTVTLVFSLNQAIAAACAGADFIAPFVGRLDDIDADGVGLVRSISELYAVHGVETKIIAASIRSPRIVSELFLAGAYIVTIPFSLVSQMTAHPLTAQGLTRFDADWATVPRAT